MQRPPPLIIEDSDELRQDFRSDDMRRVHPMLPVEGSAHDRYEYMRCLDRAAYATISVCFPDFRPPWAASHR